MTSLTLCMNGVFCLEGRVCSFLQEARKERFPSVEALVFREQARNRERERERGPALACYSIFLSCLSSLQAELLMKLRADNHRCLLFTQFSKMLDVLEAWINHQGFTYVRLDGSTKVRQKPFNSISFFFFLAVSRHPPYMQLYIPSVVFIGFPS